MNLMNLITVSEYIQTRGRVFPSEASFAWFCRCNKEKLSHMGALARPTRRTLVNAIAMDQAVLLIGEEACKRK